MTITTKRKQPKTTTRKRRGRATSPLTIMLGAVAALALIATVLSVGGDDDAVPQVAAVTVAGDALPRYERDGADAAQDLPAPVLSGRDTLGEPMTIRAGDRPMAILFLAHWCSHCQREVRMLTEAIGRDERLADIDLRAVSTLVDPRAPNHPPIAWLEREGWPVPTMLDDGSSSAARAAGLDGTPFWVFVHADGTVAGRIAGEIGPERLRAIMDGLARNAGAGRASP